MTRKLTERQRRFVEHYTACGNATEAARRALYKCPDPEGKRLLRHPMIAAAVTAVAQQRTEVSRADRHERLVFLTSVMRDRKAAMSDRLRATDLLARMQGDYIASARPPVVPKTESRVRVYVPDNFREAVEGAIRADRGVEISEHGTVM